LFLHRSLPAGRFFQLSVPHPVSPLFPLLSFSAGGRKLFLIVQKSLPRFLATKSFWGITSNFPFFFARGPSTVPTVGLFLSWFAMQTTLVFHIFFRIGPSFFRLPPGTLYGHAPPPFGEPHLVRPPLSGAHNSIWRVNSLPLGSPLFVFVFSFQDGPVDSPSNLLVPGFFA